MRRIPTVLAALGCAITSSCAPGPVTQGPDDARSAFPVASAARVVRNVVYAQYGERRLELDLYLPSESSHPRPVPGVLVVRGGGWQSGDKESFGFIAAHLAESGFAAASIEYRTSAEAPFPAAVHDVKAAVRWMRAHAAAYGIDPGAIGALGGSAGGHLVTMLATSAGVSELEGTGGDPEASSEVQAVVAMGCVCSMDWNDPAVADFIGAPLETEVAVTKAASPGTYVSRRSAPLLLLHSRTDPVVPFELSLRMEALYRSAGASVTLTPVDAPNTHAFWNETRYFPEAMDRAVAFLRAHLAKGE